MHKSKIVSVVAMGKNRELGKDNKLLWHIPDDLKRFKRLTEGHPIIMGRKTFESIVSYVGGPLPKRTNIVLTKRGFVNPFYDAILAGSLEEAIGKAESSPGADEIHIGGGAELYKQALPMIDKLYLTLIDASADADSFFPEYEREFTKKVFEEEHEWKELKYRFVNLERR